MYSHSPANAGRGSRGRRGAQRCQGRGTGGTPRPSSAHSGSPSALGQRSSCPQNAARERSRVQALRRAFLALQAALPAVPSGTKLSKLDVLLLATSHIAHLSHALGRGPPPPSHPPRRRSLLYPLKKWPMRSHLYAGPCWGGGSAPPAASAVPGSQEHTGWDTGLAMGQGPH
ncbi:transcription factor 23 [Colius striatus]|uniref:transcription factor 23 n=1 Tax=Colius striatus TaxID=57412 RepID=UPI002B1E0CF8|nr:transcription factor 23 [Colius striatus]